jgi:hypothetical protein
MGMSATEQALFVGRAANALLLCPHAKRKEPWSEKGAPASGASAPTNPSVGSSAQIRLLGVAYRFTVGGFAMKRQLARAAIEVGFIGFLFYSNLLMGEYERSGPAQSRGLLWALGDIFTPTNLTICVFAGLAGHLVVEVLRKRLS